MKIILDAMSGDYAPLEILRGAAQAKGEYPEIDILLVGDPDTITSVARKDGLDIEKMEIYASSSVISMEDAPLSVIHDKKDSSMGVGLKLLSQGEGDAFVSAGNTGALLAGASLIVRRLKGIARPGIGAILPLLNPVLLLDSGANITVTEENLEMFAVMGSVYMSKIYGIERPRVGQINNGAEPTKGLPLQIAAYERLSKNENINFVGNIEGKDIPFDTCDVLVADGFTGNVVLKLTEGMGKMMLHTMKDLFYANALTMLSASLMKTRINDLKHRFDSSEHGGAPILGIRKPVIKAHGGSDAKAIKNAIFQAVGFVKDDINGEIERVVNELSDKSKA
ncbi:MAG: phosphate acyltransferase PlsX [Ruminococcaceae bacterium]|nr:phosphate acyltransferase PlsX [Oscillospiraceae bacterium]